MKYCHLEDTELIKLASGQDEKAFREIYDRHWQEIFLLAYRKVRSKEIAEELTQNLFVSLWEKIGTVAILNLRAWLMGAIKYSIINYYKSQIVHEKYLSYIQGGVAEEGQTAERLTLLKELNDAIDKGISLLPQKTQQVFKLSRIENRPVKEISQTLNISEKTVEYHITQSLKLMRVYLKDYLVFILFFLIG